MAISGPSNASAEGCYGAGQVNKLAASLVGAGTLARSI